SSRANWYRRHGWQRRPPPLADRGQFYRIPVPARMDSKVAQSRRDRNHNVQSGPQSGPERHSYWRSGQGGIARWQRAAEMTSNFRNHVLIGLVVLLTAVTLSSGCSNKPAAPAAPQHPDLSGLWLGNRGNWSMTRGAKLGTEPDVP